MHEFGSTGKKSSLTLPCPFHTLSCKGDLTFTKKNVYWHYSCLFHLKAAGNTVFSIYDQKTVLLGLPCNGSKGNN